MPCLFAITVILMRLAPLLLVTLCSLAPSAWAEAYKCIGATGRVSYSFVPCPVAMGETRWARKVEQAQWVSLNPEDAEPHVINQRATRILQTSYRTKVRYTVHYLPGVAPPRAKKPRVAAKPMRCLDEGGHPRCDGLARP